MQDCISLAWKVGPATSPTEKPENWVPATVPGAVQLDWAAAHDWPDWWFADNWQEYLWMEDRWWRYRTEFPTPALEPGQTLLLDCGGVDYACSVWLNGVELHRQEGMFRGFSLDLARRLEPAGGLNTLEILVEPTPKRAGHARGRGQASACCKPAVSYGWDWHPRLIPLGIWETTLVRVAPVRRILDAEVRTTLSPDLKTAHLRLRTKPSQAGAGEQVHWTLFDPDGRELTRLEAATAVPGTWNEQELPLQDPRLWWPHDHGDQPLYRAVTEFRDAAGVVLDRQETRFGLRRTRLVMHEGAWNEPEGYPKSRSHPPITLEINGRVIFAKGTNWVNPEVFPGTITRATYEPLLELVRDAHMNLLRIWGGAIVNKESFFELCDELGIMVWQEFPLACNEYPDDAAYLAVLDLESRAIIKRLRRHPSLVMWCGGNELFNGWSRMTDQSLPLRLLNRNCYDLDPLTPFMPTSPVSGMAHGNYLFRYEDGREVYQAMPEARFTAYTEFGMPGLSNIETIRQGIPEDELWPPRPGTTWETHHAFGAWVGETWLCPQTLEHYFGPAQNLEELVECSQFLQAAGYQCIYEEARRQKPRCSMALNWCYNEPWPTAANNSLLNWPAVTKPAYHAVAASCRPVLASARLPKVRWSAGEVFSAGLWLLNDSYAELSGAKLEAVLVIGGREIPLLTWDIPAPLANTNIPGPTARAILPPDLGEFPRFDLVLRVTGHQEWNSRYTLLSQSEIASPTPRETEEGEIAAPVNNI